MRQLSNIIRLMPCLDKNKKNTLNFKIGPRLRNERRENILLFTLHFVPKNIGISGRPIQTLKSPLQFNCLANIQPNWIFGAYWEIFCNPGISEQTN